MIRETAPAKINLWLHVGPLRPDRLHDLESLFVFATQGDVIGAAPAQELSLTVEGPFAAALAPFSIESNLVLKAAHALRAASGVDAGAALTLDKRLPVAAGIGGGSSDAAAALRALVRLWRVDISPTALASLAFQLGADVPACLEGRPVYVGGAGEAVTPGPHLPSLWTCLVNPGVATPTGPVFQAFDEENPSPPPPLRYRPAQLSGPEEVREAGRMTANDLEPYAVRREKVIGEVLRFLAETPGAIFSRMSGSGATVFALYEDSRDADRAAHAAAARGWWSMATRIAAGDAGGSME